MPERIELLPVDQGEVTTLCENLVDSNARSGLTPCGHVLKAPTLEVDQSRPVK